MPTENIDFRFKVQSLSTQDITQHSMVKRWFKAYVHRRGNPSWLPIMVLRCLMCVGIHKGMPLQLAFTDAS